MIKTFSKGGIHPAPNKYADRKIKLLPLPTTAYLPLSQHIGAPAEPVVERGEHVGRGQLIAVNTTYISAGLHAPISGTVKGIEPVALANGKPGMAIIISATDEEHRADTAAREAYWRAIEPGHTDRQLSESLSADVIRKAILDAGIVGLGGATFPAHVKLSTKESDKPELLIINGCECEPYLMCDDALMSHYPARIVEGVELMMKAAGVGRAVIAVEDNKPGAIAALKSHIDPAHDISIQVVKTKYPQGGEKQLVEAITGRRIPSGKLPLSVGAIVNNVATAFAIWQCIASGQPLIERVVTVTGDITESERRNYIVAIGTPLSALPFTPPQRANIIVGGPMMGHSAVCLEAPITKGTSGLTILDAAPRRQPMACVRCGACVEACPMGLEPYLLSTYGRLHMWDEARSAGVADCMECGSCSWSCPSSRPLLEYIKIAKQRSRK